MANLPPQNARALQFLTLPLRNFKLLLNRLATRARIKHPTNALQTGLSVSFTDFPLVTPVQITLFMNISFVCARAKLCGAALLALSFGLSGCGGGGGSNGPATPKATATPTPIPTSANATYDKTRFTPNYVTFLEQNRSSDNPVALLRWTRFPLSIYFERDGNYTTGKQALAVQGFNRWVTKTGSNGVTYNVVNSATNADITVNFGTFTGGAGDILGQTFFSYDAQSRVLRKGVNIQIKFTGDTNNDLITASHEFGHALGVNGHSNDEKDLMYFTGNDQFGGNVTTPDLNTVKTSYNGIFNKDANARIAPGSGQIISATIR